VKGKCLKTSILLNGFAPLIHCSSAGFQPPQSSSLFTRFCSINKHAQELKWKNVPREKKIRQHDLVDVRGKKNCTEKTSTILVGFCLLK